MKSASVLTIHLFMRKLASNNLDHVIFGFEDYQGHGQDVIYRTGIPIITDMQAMFLSAGEMN